MKRYSSLAIYLHWSIAIAIFAMLISGWSLHYELFNSKQFIFQLFQWHKSIGIVVLSLVFLRVIWRFIKSPPATPEQLVHKEKAIHFGHVLIYGLLIIMPLSGWILVSTDPKGIPTIIFGLLDLLHFPLGDIVHQPAKLTHYYVAFVISAVVVGHIAMAIKHQSQGIQLLQRMQASRWVKASLVLSIAAIGFLSINVFQVSAPAELKSISLKEKGGESNASENYIQFSGEHTGNAFNGVFTDWQLDTDLDISNKTMNRFNLTVSMAASSTGSDLYDQTLKESDWFDVGSFPTATYQSTSAEFISDTQVRVVGTFTMKQTTIPLVLDMTIDGNSLKTEFKLKRQEVNLGQDADPDADWVSEEIQIKAQVAL